MTVLKLFEEEYEAEYFIKGNDYITGYIGKLVVCEFRGISDFSGYELEEGKEFKEPELSEIELLRKQNEELAQTLDMVLTDLLPSLIGGS